MSDEDRPIIERAFPYTMTGFARLQGLVDAVRYVERSSVPGAFAECGVWRGGSVLGMLLTLQDEGTEDRDVYLYDTFEGMTQPTEQDVSHLEQPALETWRSAEAEGEQAWGWLLGDFDENGVRNTVLSSGYPEARVHFVRGRVEETIPGTMPERLALLRLDTDWYESTRHELEHLYPRLVPGGVLIIDDYGHWEGARRACDEYFDRIGERLLLNRLDYAARIAVKPGGPAARS
jgi:O-methyltransferase